MIDYKAQIHEQVKFTNTVDTTGVRLSGEAVQFTITANGGNTQPLIVTTDTHRQFSLAAGESVTIREKPKAAHVAAASGSQAYSYVLS